MIIQRALTVLRLISRYWAVLFFIVAIGAIGLALSHSPQVITQTNFSASFLAVPVVIYILSLWWHSKTWIATVSSVILFPISTGSAFTQISLQNLGKYLPGKVWGMAARAGDMREAGIPVSAIGGATYLEQLQMLHSGGVLAVVLFAMVFPSGWALLIALASAITLPVAALLNRQLINTVFRVLHAIRSAATIPNTFQLSTKIYIGLFCRYLISWLLVGMIFVGLYLSFISSEMDVHIFSTLMLANTVGFLAGFIAIFSPGGLGVREAASIGILATILPLGEAAALSVSARMFQVLGDLLCGVFAFWVSNMNKAKKSRGALS